jgi:hypothetical protein
MLKKFLIKLGFIKKDNSNIIPKRKRCYNCQSSTSKTKLIKIIFLRYFKKNIYLCSYCEDRILDECSCCRNKAIVLKYVKIQVDDKFYYHSLCHRCFCKLKLKLCIHCDCYHYNGLCDISIHSYGYNPKKSFYKSYFEFTKQFFGFELEYENVDKTDARKIKSFDNEKHFYITKDGSLINGWEIKNQPMTYKYIMNNNIIEQLFEYFKNADCSDRCGLHFHISRNSFTKDGIKNIDWFVNNQLELIQKYGGRNIYNNIYCHEVHKKKDEWGKKNINRHVAVNLRNKDTVELRFCKSTNDYETFIKRLTFIKLLCDFCNKKKFKEIDKKNTYIEFLDILTKNNI